MGIRFILMVNKQGQTRLAQYYEYLTLEERRALEAEIVRKCLARTEQQVSLSLSLSLSLSIYIYIYVYIYLFISLSPQRTGKMQASFSGKLMAESTGGDYSRGADLAGGGSVQRGERCLAAWLTVDEPRRGGVDPSSPITPTTIPRFPQVSFNPLVIMVSSVCDESDQFSKHSFRDKLSKFWQLAQAKRDLISGQSFILLFVVKNHFQQYIICLCLESFAQNHVLRDN